MKKKWKLLIDELRSLYWHRADGTLGLITATMLEVFDLWKDVDAPTVLIWVGLFSLVLTVPNFIVLNFVDQSELSWLWAEYLQQWQLVKVYKRLGPCSSQSGSEEAGQMLLWIFFRQSCAFRPWTPSLQPQESSMGIISWKLDTFSCLSESFWEPDEAFRSVSSSKPTAPASSMHNVSWRWDASFCL